MAVPGGRILRSCTGIVRNITARIASPKPIHQCQQLTLQNEGLRGRQFHTTCHRKDLMEFFDDKENWGESSVKVGRPWKLDELRLKSNTDLHKLWYVLLKERNVIMTMEAEYKRQSELFPSPERLEKVEESMENLLDVVTERDRAYHLLETGETGEPGERVAINQLGLYYTRRCQEHHVPLEYSRKFKKYTCFNGPWQDRYKQLLREKLLLKERYIYRCRRIVEERRKKVFPDVQLE